jgi:hypothetical protein
MPAGSYLKLGGIWGVAAGRVYRKIDGVWKPTDEVYVKNGGIWRLCHEYDVTPPAVPEISLEIVDTDYWENHVQKSGRYIKVGVRTPGGNHDTDLKRIRVLTTYNGKSPVTYTGGKNTSTPDDDHPNEPWSGWHYNGFGGSAESRDSSVFHYKKWPRNASNQTNIPAGKEFFAAWAEDLNGNWSAGNFASIVVPKKGVDAANRVTKEARFQVNSTGSWSQERFEYGRLKQSNSPRSRGLLFYGNQIRANIGARGDPKIKKAEILVQRRNDSGTARANVYIFRHPYGAPANIGQELNHHEVIKLGGINKGEQKWFPIPNSYIELLEKDVIKGFGFWYKDPDHNQASAQDYSVFNSKDDNIRTGELHVVWQEIL